MMMIDAAEALFDRERRKQAEPLRPFLASELIDFVFSLLFLSWVSLVGPKVDFLVPVGVLVVGLVV
jgi:hypothetical protein